MLIAFFIFFYSSLSESRENELFSQLNSFCVVSDSKADNKLYKLHGSIKYVLQSAWFNAHLILG